MNTKDATVEMLREELKRISEEMGGALFGVADLEALQRDKPDLLASVGAGFSRAVVMGFRLQGAVLEGIAGQPTPLYFHHYRQVNNQLDRMALLVANRIQRAGRRALAVPASQVIERNPMVAHISHKRLAWGAGLGFIGRNNLLVNATCGAQARYVSVLTDLPLAPDAPCAGSCGPCRACVTACPAHAIRERAEDFDLDACFGKLTEFTHLPFIGQHICGVCVKACSAAEH